MTTAREIIQDAFEQLTVYAPGETANSIDAARGLATLNSMLDSWSNESLACFANLEQSGTLVVGQQSYTVGPGGDFDMQRPINITVGPGAARIRDTNGNDYDVEVITQDRWNEIGAKYTTSDIPDTLFYDPQYPLGIINIFPIPIISYTLFWDSRLQLADFGSLNAAMSLPPGYYKALTTNLSVALYPYYRGSAQQPDTESAMIAKGNIKRSNLREVIASFDPEIVSRASPTYNVYSDSSSGTRG